MQIKPVKPVPYYFERTLFCDKSDRDQCVDGPKEANAPRVANEVPLQQRVIEIVTHCLRGAGSKRVGPSASLKRDLQADALDKIEIILALEDSFDINISDLDAERIDTVRDAVDCVFHALNRSRPVSI